ncbi:MAG: peptidylprolyl isomerase [Thermoplasmata archaeon]|nr:MAG: peptidylprolyl isomerase [Thermoplasmata archaeon]
MLFKWKLTVVPVICLLLSAGVIGILGNGVATTTSESTRSEGGESIYDFGEPKPTDPDNTVVIMEITNYGSIVIELYDSLAPQTVSNFIKYVDDGFYNGLIFHRVAKDFVIQGGGYGPGMEYKDPTYPPINLEIHEDLTHVDGALGMARGSDPDSATTQFYISVGDNHHLDGEYAVFGQVISGHDIYKLINEVPVEGEQPVDDIIIRRMAFYQPVDISFKSHSLKDTIYDTVIIVGEVDDSEVYIEKVEVRIDGNSWEVAEGTSTWSYTWDTTKVSDGIHTVYVRAHDGFYYSAVQNLTLIVNNSVNENEPAKYEPVDDDSDDDGDDKEQGEDKEESTNLFPLIVGIVVIIAIILLIVVLMIIKSKKTPPPERPKEYDLN